MIKGCRDQWNAIRTSMLAFPASTSFAARTRDDVRKEGSEVRRTVLNHKIADPFDAKNLTHRLSDLGYLREDAGSPVD